MTKKEEGKVKLDKKKAAYVDIEVLKATPFNKLSKNNQDKLIEAIMNAIGL